MDYFFKAAGKNAKTRFLLKDFFPIKIRIINLVSTSLEYPIKVSVAFFFLAGWGESFRFILPAKTQDEKQ